MNKKFVAIQILFLCALAALFVMYLRSARPVANTLVVSPISGSNTVATADRSRDMTGFPLVNPSVTASLGKYFIIKFSPLREKLAAIQAKHTNKTFIYFLYLNNSAWIGLNERDMFTAASTIKVPLAITIYKLIEQGKINLDDTYTLTESDLDSNFGELYKAGAGKVLTIHSLLATMLTDSDNTAARALIHVTQLLNIADPFSDVYDEMGWQEVDFGSKPTYIKINEKTLANMFISLYNSTYLNPRDSEAVLEYLDKSKFDQQIAGGVPKGIAVAHKIGIDDVEGTFSDCGIVYVPNRPYVLCLGSQGTPQAEADRFMQEISRTVYEYVINN